MTLKSHWVVQVLLGLTTIVFSSMTIFFVVDTNRMRVESNKPRPTYMVCEPVADNPKQKICHE